MIDNIFSDQDNSFFGLGLRIIYLLLIELLKDVWIVEE